jgi:hypothetical protein
VAFFGSIFYERGNAEATPTKGGKSFADMIV